MGAPAIAMISLEDMENIALGGAFLGTGGGGDPYIGKLMARQAIAANGPVKVTVSYTHLTLPTKA